MVEYITPNIVKYITLNIVKYVTLDIVKNIALNIVEYITLNKVKYITIQYTIHSFTNRNAQGQWREVVLGAIFLKKQKLKHCRLLEFFVCKTVSL